MLIDIAFVACVFLLEWCNPFGLILLIVLSAVILEVLNER